MLTVQWVNHKNSQEIPPNAIIPAQGQIVVEVKRGSIDMHGYFFMLRDPYHIPLYQTKIPQIDHGETYQMRIPLANHLPAGEYIVELYNQSDELSYQLKFNLKSRRTKRQTFLAEHKLKISKMNGRVESFKITIEPAPNSFMLQNTGSIFSGRSTNLSQNQIIEHNLLSMNQKTVTWYQIIQPAFLPIDTDQLLDYPDEYYILNPRHKYTDEPGLELSHESLDEYDGSSNPHFPLKVLKDVIGYVHRNMRYVRQGKERGLQYALETGRGDCTEYSAFVVSLLRKFGIESRMVSGMGRSNHNNWIPHAFVEVKLHGTWVPVDVIKPPKPYLQIGNLGDLIGISRKNWLDADHSEYKLELQMYKSSSRPKFSVSRKVTETGLQQISKENRKKRGIKARISKEKGIKVIEREGRFTVGPLPSETQTILILTKFGEYRKVMSMSYYNQGSLPLSMIDPHHSTNESMEAIALDSEGKVIGRGPIKM